MSTISSDMIEYLGSDGVISEDFNLIPFVGETAENRTVFSAPTCYFAAGAHLNESENQAKKQAVLNILDFISTEEGQNIIRGASPLANSYLSGVSFELNSRFEAVSDVLQQGAFGTMPVFTRGVEQTMGDALGAMLRGEISWQEAMTACDHQNAQYVAAAQAPKARELGMAEAEFPWTFRDSRTQELAVTNFVVDCMRLAAGTDIAIELGTAVRGEIFQGMITEEDIDSVVRVDKKLYQTQVTGQQLWDIIEQGVQKENSSWFIAVSGLQYRYQPAQADSPGVLLALMDEEGNQIKLDEHYEVAVSENQLIEVANVLNLYTNDAVALDLTLREAVIEQIVQQGSITPVLDGRIIVE